MIALSTEQREYGAFRRLLWTALMTTLLAGCATNHNDGPADLSSGWQPGDIGAPSQVTPSESLKIALELSDFAWRPFARNILHGPDADGVLVRTPDVSYQENERPGWWIPGEVNRGIPYKWGGFDDPASFADAVAQGMAAGDVSTPAKRIADNDGVSRFATGLDCSGFVSRCLRLPTVHDTAALPALCDLIAPHQLQPGDLLNVPRSHVVLVAGWMDAERTWIYYYETGGLPDHWRPGLKAAPLNKLLALGFKPMRYRGMARETVPSGKEILTRSLRSTAALVPDPQIGEP